MERDQAEGGARGAGRWIAGRGESSLFGTIWAGATPSSKGAGTPMAASWPWETKWQIAQESGASPKGVARSPDVRA